MNKLAACFFAAAMTTSVVAQLSSTLDGICIDQAGINQTSWGASPLSNYAQSSGNIFQTPNHLPGTDSHGTGWTLAAPDLQSLNLSGGSLRVIFLGKETNWDGAVGYTYDNQPASSLSYTIGQANNLGFGDHVDISMGRGVGANFDLWTSGGPNTFCLFKFQDSKIGTAGSVAWTKSPLGVETYIPSYGEYMHVDTWIASIDESTSDASNPNSNLRLAVQFFYPVGQEDLSKPVPEPASIGIVAGLALLGFAAARGIRARKQSGPDIA